MDTPKKPYQQILSALPALVKLSVPLAIAQITSISVMTADFWMMGQLGAFDLASGSLGVRLYQPFYFLALGMLSILSALVAQAIGARRPENARRIFRQGLILAVLMAVLFMLPILKGTELLIFLGQEPEIAVHASAFLFYTALSFPFMLIFLTMRFFTIGHQRTNPQLLASLIALASNVILNPVLTYGWYGFPQMGLAGVACATLICYMIACLVLGFQIGLLNPFRQTRPYQNWWRIDKDLLGTMVRIGLPNSLLVASETGMFVAAAFIIGFFGAAALAAAAITNQIAAITFMLPLSVSQASAILVGQAAGAGQQEKVRAYGWAGGVLGIIISVPMTLLLAIFPENLASLFLNIADLNTPDSLTSSTLKLVVPMILIAALFQLADGAQIIFTANLRGLNDTKIPALYGLICFWGIGIGSGIFLSRYLDLGPVWVWAGLAIGLSVNAMMLLIRWYRCLKAIKEGSRSLLETEVR